MFLGKWKTRSDHPFGISWVKNVKLLGYKFGYELTDDDIFKATYMNFSNTLNLWYNKCKSVKGKSSVLNTYVVSKVLYFVQCQTIPSHYINMIQKSCFKFIWGSVYEPIARKTLYLDLKEGGLRIPNIQQKISAFYLSHLFKLLNDCKHPWTYFARYWIGMQLRKFNPSLFTNNEPHSEFVPSFYLECLNIFTKFVKDIKSDNFTHWNVKQIYAYLINPNNEYNPKCIKEFPLINFKNVFKNIFSSAVDPDCRNTCFKLVHSVLYVNKYLYDKKFNKASKKCTFCISDETFQHLFLDCSMITPLNKTVLFLMDILTIEDISISSKCFQFFDVQNSDAELKYVYLVFLSESRHIIWKCRNLVKHEKILLSPLDLIVKFLNRIKFRIL